MNKYCIVVYIFLTLLILKYDSFSGILLLILIIAPFKCSIKEFFYVDESSPTELPASSSSSPEKSDSSSSSELSSSLSLNSESPCSLSSFS
jgi:hypothetical protein